MTSPLLGFPPVITERYAERLDTIAGKLGGLADHLEPGPVKDLLSGTWLGHPIHPVLTDVTIGAWTSAWLLDIAGGREARAAARRLVGLGVLSAAPTALTGWSDWVDVEGEERRIGVVHAIGNGAATIVYAASWIARRRGRNGAGVALGWLGAGIASGTAYLGGHLVFGKGVGVDVTTFDRLPLRSTSVMEAADLTEGKPTVVDVAGVPILLVRRGERIFAMHDECTHRGGPLHEGNVEGDAVTCPWHGSCFALSDGSIRRGPATAPQPSYRAWVEDGSVRVAPAD